MRGKSGYVPFWPGGFDDEVIEPTSVASDSKGFRTVAPGLPRGLRLPGDPIEEEELVAIEGKNSETFEESEERMVRISCLCQLSSKKIQDEQDDYEIGEDLEVPSSHLKGVDELLPTSVWLIRDVFFSCTY